MRALLLTGWFAIVAPAVTADPPAKPAEPLHAVLTFGERKKQPKSWFMKLELKTASGSVYELPILLDTDKETDPLGSMQRAMMDANWMADPSRKERTIRIYGARKKDGTVDAVKSLALTNRIVHGEGELPNLTAVGGATVDAREDKGEAKPERVGMRPKGPDLGAEPHVEFDFTHLPDVQDVYWNFVLKLHTTQWAEPDKSEFEIISQGVHDGFLCRIMAEMMNERGIKAERVGKTKLRVYGWVHKDRFYPVTKGSIESPELKGDQLPKVTQPKAGG